MTTLKARGPLSEYGKGATSAEVNYASPHRLVQMLLEGALEKIAVAKGALGRGEVKQKNDHITWAISIINGLRMSLDHGAGGEIARNLEDLYDYMCRRLLEVSRDDQVEKLDEVTSLLLEIKGAWDALPAEVTGPADTDKPSNLAEVSARA